MWYYGVFRSGTVPVNAPPQRGCRPALWWQNAKRKNRWGKMRVFFEGVEGVLRLEGVEGFFALV
jgi:hypothetical protein